MTIESTVSREVSQEKTRPGLKIWPAERESVSVQILQIKIRRDIYEDLAERMRTATLAIDLIQNSDKRSGLEVKHGSNADLEIIL